AKFDLQFFIKQTADGLVMALEYNTDVFRESSARRFLKTLTCVLEEIVAEPRTRLSELRLSPAPERERTLTLGIGPELAISPGRLYDRFLRQSELTPDAVALTHGSTRLTYAEMRRASFHLAVELQRRGVSPEQPVAVAGERNCD